MFLLNGKKKFDIRIYIKNEQLRLLLVMSTGKFLERYSQYYAFALKYIYSFFLIHKLYHKK